MSDTALRLYLMNLVQYLKYPDGRKIMSEVCCSGLDFFCWTDAHFLVFVPCLPEII